MVLPEKYYRDYFLKLMHEVAENYSILLEKKEVEFINAFHSLPEDAQCLYIRMVMRRSEFFQTKNLNYSEIKNKQESITHLGNVDFVHKITKHDVHLILDLLPTFQKAELLNILPNSPSYKRLSKSNLLHYILENVSEKELILKISKQYEIYQQCKIEEVQKLFFLYFGTLHRNLSEFIVRDLGHRHFVNFQTEKLTPYFKTKQEIDEKWQASLWRVEGWERMEINTPEVFFSWIKDILKQHEMTTEPALYVLDSLMLSAAKWLEKEKELEHALWLYQRAKRLPAREREIRILHKLGKKEVAINLCEELLAHTRHAEEYFFARDFKAKISEGKRLKSTTLRLKKASKISIDNRYKYHVEQGVLAAYIEQGFQGVHLENQGFRALFAVVFWDIIFDEDLDVFHHPFQAAPSDWRSEQFYELRKIAFQNRLDEIRDRTWISARIKLLFKTQYGNRNLLFEWHEGLEAILLVLVSFLSVVQMKSILLTMAQNLQSNGKGFPDLFIWNSESYQFIEVKSPNDTLSAQQLYWIEFMENLGVLVDVMKVEWEHL